MHTNYTIARTFLSSVEFDSSADMLSAGQWQEYSNLRVNVQVATLEGENKKSLISQTTIYVERNQSKEQPILNLKVTYSAVVVFDTPVDVADTNISHIMEVEVPQMVFNRVRNTVWTITSESGLGSVMIPDNNFAEAYQSSNENVNYSWIIRELCTMEHGNDFLRFYTLITDNIYDYNRSPLYKHYWRFFRPASYSHPDFKQCDDQLWHLLLQLLFGDFESKCKFVHRPNSLPEVEFENPLFGCKRVSELTLDELKALLVYLFSNAIADILPLFADFCIDLGYSASLQSGKCPTYEEIFTLYGAAADEDETRAEVANMIYEKLSSYYNQQPYFGIA